MFVTAVPLANHGNKREKFLPELKKLGATRVFLCEGRGFLSPSLVAQEMNTLKESIKFFEDSGFETGVWISTIGHGGPLVGEKTGSTTTQFQNIVGFHGQVSEDSFCPLDDAFSNAVCRYVAEIAKAGAKMIMLDDDFRMSFRMNKIGCYCPAHRKKFLELTGEDLDGEAAFEKIFTDGPNKYRDTYLRMTGDTLRVFARKLRAAVDSVDSSIRLGHCAVMSTYDSDGVSSFELARIFAGSTKPFLRLIGAPYWSGGMLGKLSYVIECERKQEFWARAYENADIEIFSEGDVYPRPRYAVPSAYLEGFDTALRASGGMDGILKYALDYTSGPQYETGYSQRAFNNISLYNEIEKRFSGKTAVGVQISAPMNIISGSVYPDDVQNEEYYAPEDFFRADSQFLCDNSLPITYSSDGAIVVFGEAARRFDLSLLDKGLIIDAAAARILTERGVDVGIKSAMKKVITPLNEQFKTTPVPLDSAVTLYQAQTDIRAKVLSRANTNAVSYRFENTHGQRFLVFLFDAQRSRKSNYAFRSYCRQSELVENYEWLAGKKLPAVLLGNPDAYLLCKEGKESLTVGIWNFSADNILTPVINLARQYSRAEFVNCSGELKNDTVHLHCEIPAFSFACVELFF